MSQRVIALVHLSDDAVQLSLVVGVRVVGRDFVYQERLKFHCLAGRPMTARTNLFVGGWPGVYSNV